MKNRKWVQLGIRITKEEHGLLEKATELLSKRVAGIEVTKSGVVRHALIEFYKKEGLK